MESVVKQVVANHLEDANHIVETNGSALLRKTFRRIWANVDYGSITASLNDDKIRFNETEIDDKINAWIKEMQDLRIEEFEKYKQMDDESEFQSNYFRIESDIDHSIAVYNRLKNAVGLIEEKFANEVRVYRSPLRQALHDISMVYQSIEENNGDFAGFKGVSVYMHGIESNGDDFFKSAAETAEEDDIIVRENKNGEKDYFIAYKDRKGNVVVDQDEPLPYEKLKKKDAYQSQEGQVHLVYETDTENEHRQETSDVLTEELIEMGLMDDETTIDMFGHSYGGRRSLQFAMDYPDHVNSITTIGTPYDTNTLGDMADEYPNQAEWVNRHPKEYSNYLDFNEENNRTDDGVRHSNAYTDMASEKMADSINNLKTANPETYQKLQDMEITAAAGYRTEYTSTHSMFAPPPEEHKTDSDDVVSVDSQNAVDLKGLIDKRPEYEVDGSGLLTDPGHVNEITDENFVNLVQEVNDK